MKMLGPKAFLAVFRIFVFFLKEFLKKEPDQRMKVGRTTKLENLKSRK